MPRPLPALLTLLVALSGTAASARAGAVHTGAGAARRALVQRAAHVPAGAAVGGTVSPSSAVRLTLALTPADPQALAGYAQGISDPASALYRHYLSVGQFAARFGAGAVEVAQVRAALEEAGITVGRLADDGLSLSASGTAAEIEGAFDTELERVTLQGGGAAYADVTDPTLPAAAAADVQSIAGLDSLPAAAPQDLLRPHGARSDVRATHHLLTGASGPSSCIAEQSAAGYTAAEIGSHYGMDGAWNADDLGSGSTVGLVELEPYRAADINAFETCDGTPAAVSNVSIDGGASCQSAQGNDPQCGLEDTLDIEDIAGLAPASAVQVYEAPNTNTGLLDLYRSMVTHDIPIISTSWGLCEAASGTGTIAAENILFQEAAVQGETVFAAAGDNGSDDCGSGVRAVDDPASQPYVTGVGGTTMTSDTLGAAESVWNDSSTNNGAGGGGVSRVWAAPSYQAPDAVSQSAINCTAAPGAASTSTNCREVPDVSADADPATGYDVRWDGSWMEVGGTSAAAPTWASLVALADSSSACAANGVRVGFANAVLYALPASDFNDVTTGTNSADGVGGYPAGIGYDMASGRGAPNGAALLPALCATPTTITASLPTTTTTTTTTPPPAPITPVPTASPPTATAPTSTTTPTATGASGSGVDVVRFLSRRVRRTILVGARVRLALRARDRDGLRLRYSARRLPRGLRIDRNTGVISGRPSRTERSTSGITARDTRGDSETIVVRWIVARR